MGWSRFVRRGRWDDERARELQAYIEHEIDDNLARGLPPDEARRAAYRTLGNPTLVREEIYQMNTLRFVDAFWRDLKYGARLLRKNPTFALVAILTLALGTGANAAIFQLINAIRLRPLPVERPGELVSVGIDRHGKGRVGLGYGARAIHTESLWSALRARQQAFTDVAAWGGAVVDLGTSGEYQPASGYFVSGNYFDLLGVRPEAGRLLSEADDRKGCGEPPVVLSYGFWQSRFGGRADVIGQPITLSRQPFVVAGVTPPEFFGMEVGRTFDVMVPMCAEPLLRPGSGSAYARQDAWWLDVAGRLKPGWTVESAAAHLAALSPDIFGSTVPTAYNAETAANYRAATYTATPASNGVSVVRTRYATHLWILLGATGLVLLIACANLANLMLARATAREREIAVRLAIGASRGRLIRQMLSESLLIAACGAAGGALLAGWMSQALVVFLSTRGNRLFVDLAPDWRLFVFITLIAVGACLLFGLSPALRATATDPGRSMQSGSRSVSEGPAAYTLRRGLVVAQVALSLVLVVGAMLFARSLRNIGNVDPGFQPDGLIATSVTFRRTAMPANMGQTMATVLERVRAVPGVRSAAETMIPPLAGAEWNGRVVVDGELQQANAYFNLAGSQYFETLGVPLVTGRPFGTQDTPQSEKVAIVNESFIRRFLGGRPALDRTFQMESSPGAPQPHYRIVGVVRDSTYRDVREPMLPVAYLPFSQETRFPPFLDLLIRTEVTASSVTPALTRAIAEAAPSASVSYRPLPETMRDLLVTERLMATLSGFFGLLAILIASIGLYGVMSYMVSRRKVEIGIRMALGAEPRAVLRMVLGESGVLLVAGLLVGLALAFFASGPASALLFQLEPRDPLSFAAAAGALAAVSLMAAFVPAWRASRVAPTVALRE